MSKIVIRNPALINMLVSSIEVYKKEALGMLLGVKRGKTYYIRYAINFQKAKRGYESIDIDDRTEKRINSLLTRVSKYRLVGDFHSHPDGPYKLSLTDKKDMKETATDVSVLVVIEKGYKKPKRWKYTNRQLQGSVDGYYVTVQGYEHSKGKIKKIPVKAPYVKNLNRIAKLHQMSN
ncbi:MAG: Mov34/MPN/PAD-1 family protein [Candidatus Aenigmarchaeota archaeon]|nr:Mov34/MPN/PAD-1 family protein [Candidatus Aenigmarchaeota archaeon]